MLVAKAHLLESCTVQAKEKGRREQVLLGVSDIQKPPLVVGSISLPEAVLTGSI